MEVDIIGADNVAEFIKTTGLTKFSVDRIGSSRGNLPVFEVLNSNTNDKAVSEFKRWAQIINNSNAYKLTLFDKVENVLDENGEERTLKSKSKNNKSEIYFKLKAEDQHQVNGVTSANNYEDIKKQVLADIQNEQRIKALEDKIKQLEEEADEEEAEDLSGLNGLNLPNILNAINAIKSMSSQPSNPTINGVNDQNNKLANINKAIKILHKHDANIDTDLLKLAEIAEDNPAMFNTLLNTLRKM